jgi:predicted  nucleic acid-binding Zn-ribbon protein
MSNDFIQNAVNALYQSNELMALKGELANLKAERDQLKADLEKSDGVVWTLSVENARLKAEVERLTKAGDVILSEWSSGDEKDAKNFLKALVIWHTAKGVQS